LLSGVGALRHGIPRIARGKEGRKKVVQSMARCAGIGHNQMDVLC
ncbi:hypothetical protein A2U01_0034523, partial [Trifolium medium]|nr:hypothetical protein [Trifolium medium]